MPSPTRQLDEHAARRHLTESVFGGVADRRVGLELEWLTRTPSGARPTLRALDALIERLGPLPRGGAVTVEPGGQLELSTAPMEGPDDACEAAATDLYTLDHACAGAGIDLIALGHDPSRPPATVRAGTPRYDAMAAYFADRWPAALEMMTNTASIQLNVGYGLDDDERDRRWRLANALGPVMVATFANSPFAQGGPSGWHSTRWRHWQRIDPRRTRLPDDVPLEAAWARYAFDAPVMLVRESPDVSVPLLYPFPFARWLAEGHELGYPTLDDLDYHLTTLFPPVRPRGWFELRYLDALPTPFWQVATSVITTVLDDEALGAEAAAVCAPTADLWVDAAQLALGHPALEVAARRLFELCLDELEATDPEAAASVLVRTFHDHWVDRGRTPADDRLDHWRSTGEVVPRAESPIPYASFAEVAP